MKPDPSQPNPAHLLTLLLPVAILFLAPACGGGEERKDPSLSPARALPRVPCDTPLKAADVIALETNAGERSPSPEQGASSRSPILEMIDELTPQERSALLYLLNHGTEEDLIAIDGIAETRARAILSSRPIFELSDLMLLRGFGPALFAKVIAHKDEATR